MWRWLCCACRYGVLFSLLKLTGYYFGIVVCQMDYIFIDGVAILSLSMTLLQLFNNPSLHVHLQDGRQSNRLQSC